MMLPRWVPQRVCLEERLRTNREVRHCAGLAFLVSNLLLPLFNRLVGRAGSGKVRLSSAERTAASGWRAVYGKTRFPRVAGLVVNEVAMYPFHSLQKACAPASRALGMHAGFAKGPSCLPSSPTL
ncbi:MAG TPA: hypothetical protein VFB20_16200 [Burkholderiales bacterium]|nr:hypothetical protein [Burkholderiales bacterium]